MTHEEEPSLGTIHAETNIIITDAKVLHLLPTQSNNPLIGSQAAEVCQTSAERRSSNCSIIYRLEPMSVLRLLCTSIDYLLWHSASVPPTPPPSTPTTPNMKSLKSEKDELNSKLEAHQRQVRRRAMSGDGCCPSSLGIGAASSAVQHGAVVRKFYSKRVPSVPLVQYIQRIQTYCAMSTAVCLAASHYIFQLALVERVVQLSEFNVHRLVLAALRVSSKLLEDRNWAQSRFCKVGGVTETEMKHLETSFCFATNFELKVDAAMLENEYLSLQEIAAKSDRRTLPSMTPSSASLASTMHDLDLQDTA